MGDESDSQASADVTYPILKEFPLHSNLLQLIPARAQRGLSTFDIEFTCIDVDGSYIALGSNVGILYLFDRRKGHLQRLIDVDHKDPITCVKILVSLECLVLFGCKNGAVIVFKVPFVGDEKLEKFTVDGLHNSAITALEWAKNGIKFFSGDESGVVVCTEIDHLEHQSRSRILMNEEINIVQLSYNRLNLVISTFFRSVIFSFKDNSVTKIGQKERKRYGPFGAIIADTSNSSSGIVFASRPGLRLWKSDISGTILETMIFKSALSQEHPIVQMLTNDTKEVNFDEFQFGHIALFNEKYILTWSDSALVLIDPDQKSVVASCPKLDPIIDVATVNDEIFVLRGLRHIVRISSAPDEYTCDKVVEEPSLIEEILVPFKELSTMVKERSDSLATQSDYNSNLFGWLKKKRSASTPAEFNEDSYMNKKSEPVDEILPKIVKLSPSKYIPVKVEENLPSSVLKSATNVTKGNDSDDIVFKPKKKNKKTRKVRFSSDALNKSEKILKQTNTGKSKDKISDSNAELDSAESHTSSVSTDKTTVTIENDSGTSDLTVPKQAINQSENNCDFSVQNKDANVNLNIVHGNPLSETNHTLSDDKQLNAILSAYSDSKHHVPPKDSTAAKNLCNDSNPMSEDLNSAESICSNATLNEQDRCISTDDNGNMSKTDIDLSCSKIYDKGSERVTDVDDIYTSMNIPQVTDGHPSTNDLSPVDDQSQSEETSSSTTEMYENDPPKYGVNWVEYKAPEMLVDLTVSDEHIFCVDIRNQMYFSRYPVLGLHWIELSQPAEKIATSPTESVVWALFKGTVYAAVQKSSTLWIDTEWVSVARDVISIAVDDDCGWYAKSNGQLIMQPKLTSSKPYGYPEIVPCNSYVVQVASRNGVVWILTSGGSLFARKSSIGKSKNVHWKEILLKELPGIDCIYLGSQQTGWIIDSNGIISFIIGVTPDSPEGLGKPWEVESSSYTVQTSSQLHRAVLKALNNDTLTSLIRGKQHICLATSTSGVWFCKTFDSLVYSNQKNIIGHLWDSVVPPGAAITTKWSLVSAAAVCNSKGPVWCVNSTGELFCLCVESNTIVAVELPCISGIRRLQPGMQSLWLLSEEGTIYVRRGITPNCPQGVWWQALDLTQLDTEQIIHISCSTEVTWASTLQGQVLVRLGSLCPSSNRKIPQAWIPISTEVEENTSLLVDKLSAIGKKFPLPLIQPSVSEAFLSKVYVGPLGYPVWALDNRGNVYARDGTTNSFPIGKDWTLIPELQAKDLCISRNAVWLLKRSGKIYRRFGISERNQCGDYWKKIPGNMDKLSVTEDDDLWGIKDDNIFLHSSFVLNCSSRDSERKLPVRSISEDDWEDIMAEISDCEP